MPRRTRASRQLVLVVASQSGDLKRIESALGQRTQVEVAEGFDAAFAALRKHHVDALVTRFEPPGTELMDFLQAAGTVQSGVGRVVIAQRRQLPRILPALKEGIATSFVLEPFLPDELWVAIRRALRTEPPRLMLVTNDRAFNHRVLQLLTVHGVDCTEAETLEAAGRRLSGAAWDACMLDVDMGEETGLDLLGEIRARAPEVRVLLCGEYELPQLVSDLRRLGAFDYLAKRVSDEQLLFRLQCAFEDRLWAEQRQAETVAPPGLDPIVGSSPAMEHLRSLVTTVAQSTAPVLVRGQTGTGKELVARHIHGLSSRRKGRFFAVNCAALTEALFESEMFGHERGAFTGATASKPGMCELANEGTLFLDEIGELAPVSQAKLLRFLQSGEFIRVGGQSVQRSEARILAATNSPLEQMIQDGRFRADLFYRLNVLQIRMPSLDEHREDLPELIAHLLKQIAAKHGRSGVRLSPRAFERLLGHSFAGNVRELQAVLERSILLTPGQVIEDVLVGPAEASRESKAELPVDIERPLREVVDSATRGVEREYLERLLAACSGSVILAAKRANVDRRNFYRKLQEHEITPEAFRPGRAPRG